MRLRRTLSRQTMREMERFLKRRRAELAGSGRRMMAQHSRAEDGRSADPLEWASASAQEEIQAALIDRHCRQVAQIDEALARLGRGEYGICRDCGNVIGLARLRALPFAQRCTRCQSSVEHRAQRASRPLVALATS
jgi:RNA polymerase-binding transcription factor